MRSARFGAVFRRITMRAMATAAMKRIAGKLPTNQTAKFYQKRPNETHESVKAWRIRSPNVTAGLTVSV